MYEYVNDPGDEDDVALTLADDGDIDWDEVEATDEICASYGI